MNSPDSSSSPCTGSTPILAIIAAMAVIAALKWSQSVTLPLAFALFIIALAWPLQNKLAEEMPHKLAFILTLLTIVTVLCLFCGALYYCGSVIAGGAPKYADEARVVYATLQEWGFTQGIQIPNVENLLELLPAGAGGSTLKGGAGMAALVFFGNCAIQPALGSFVDPLLEGRQLQLSPLAVLVVFWGWSAANSTVCNGCRNCWRANEFLNCWILTQRRRNAEKKRKNLCVFASLRENSTRPCAFKRRCDINMD